jgi:hypothetical protein
MIFSACLRPPNLQPKRPVLTGISRRRETGFHPRIVVRGQAFPDRALILIHRSDEKESRQLFLQKFRGYADVSLLILAGGRFGYDKPRGNVDS